MSVCSGFTHDFFPMKSLEALWIVDFWLRLAIGFTKGQVFSSQVGFSEHLWMESARYHHANPCSEVRRIDYDRCGHLRLRISNQTKPFLTCSVSQGHGNDPIESVVTMLSDGSNLAFSFISYSQKSRMATTCWIARKRAKYIYIYIYIFPNLPCEGC